MTSINGADVDSAADIYRVLEAAAGALSLAVVRGRKRFTLTIVPELHP